jgi:AmmeMemoRadiSam system protein A
MPIEYDEERRIPAAEDCERTELLRIARQALEAAVCGRPLSRLDPDALPERLREEGACFVTLYCGDQLRGCVGTLEARQPLAEEARIQAVAAALQDYRFPGVQIEDLPGLRIAISILTRPRKLAYACPEELISRLRPGRDGVVLKDGPQRATFLPQVWDKIPDKTLFLSMLCQKMGASENLWRLKILDVFTYQVEEIHE